MPILPHAAVAKKAITLKSGTGKSIRIRKGGLLKILSETARSATAEATTPNGVIATGTVAPADYSAHETPYAAVTNKPTSIKPPGAALVPLTQGTSLMILDDGAYAGAQVTSSGLQGNIPHADFTPV